MLSVVQTTKKWVKHAQNEEKLRHRSLFLFTTTNRFRYYLHQICRSAVFEYFILAAILTSCIIVVIQGKKAEIKLNDPFTIADIVLNAIFGSEAIIKIISYGFILHRGAYLRSSWNIFDFIVVVSGKTFTEYIFLQIFPQQIDIRYINS